MTTELSFTATGENPRDYITTALRAISGDGTDVTDLSATIEFDGFSLSAEGETLGEVAEKLNAVKFEESPTGISVEFSASGAPEVEATEAAEESTSESESGRGHGPEQGELPSQVRSNTMEHAILFLFHHAVEGSESKWVTGRELQSVLPDSLTLSQVSNTMQRLFKKSLLDRRQRESADSYTHEYSLTSAGRGEVVRLEGEPDFAETPIPEDSLDVGAVAGSLAAN